MTVAANRLVQVALPASVIEDLLRRQQLYLEQMHSLDGASHRELKRLVKQVARGGLAETVEGS